VTRSSRSLPIPESFRASLENEPGANEWLDRLPSLVREIADRWQLTLGSPFVGGMTSWTAPARRTDGTTAVLKVVWPHREAREEATALHFWDGDGAVRLLDHEREQWALLLERCTPGTKLGDTDLEPSNALAIGADLLTRLWREPTDRAPYEQLADVTRDWANTVRCHLDDLDARFDRGLLVLGADLLENLPNTARRTVVLHGDFNPGNVLAAKREPWLAIDCKPMVGDAAFDPSQFVLQVGDPFSQGDPERVLDERFKRFADLIGEDAQRCIAWGTARESEYAVWEWTRGNITDALEAMDRVAMLVRIAAL
jgi:streptomycin 6-kinase